MRVLGTLMTTPAETNLVAGQIVDIQDCRIVKKAKSEADNDIVGKWYLVAIPAKLNGAVTTSDFGPPKVHDYIWIKAHNVGELRVEP